MAARHASSLTQAQVAEAIDRPQSFVAKYEGLERRLDVVEFVEVAEVVGVDGCDVIHEIRDLLRDGRS